MPAATATEAIAAVANANRPTLDARKTDVRTMAQTVDAATLADLFALLVNYNADRETLTALAPGVQWGFAPHDQRFLGDIADQTAGRGKHREAKPLSRKQLEFVRLLIQREPYLTQVALTATTPTT